MRKLILYRHSVRRDGFGSPQKESPENSGILGFGPDKLGTLIMKIVCSCLEFIRAGSIKNQEILLSAQGII